MESTNVIAILLLIMPGLIAEKISNRMDMPPTQKTTGYGETISGILLSLPIMIICLPIVYLKTNIRTVSDLATHFNDTLFIFKFVMLTVSISILLGIIKGIFGSKTSTIVNFIRKKIFGRISIDDKSCWRNIFLDDPDAKYVEIQINSEIYKGFTKHYSLQNEEKEIVLQIPEEWAYYPGIQEKFTRVNNIYINLEKNIVIKDYDTKDYCDYCEQLSNNIAEQNH
jgi:hypothetical protein